MTKSFIVSIDVTVDKTVHKAIFDFLKSYKTNKNLFEFDYEQYQEFLNIVSYADLHIVKLDGLTINLMVLTNNI